MTEQSFLFGCGQGLGRALNLSLGPLGGALMCSPRSPAANASSTLAALPAFGILPNDKFGAIPKVRKGMNFSGNQLRAARALLGLDQEALAEKVGVSDNTIRNMEACGAEPVGGFASTRDKVRKALERLGIEFLNGGEPGVRLRKSPKPAAAPASPSKPVPVTRTAPPKKTRPRRS